MRDLALKILKMSLNISVAVTSEGLDVMDDSQGQGCKRTHIKLISLGEVEFDGGCKIRYPLKALLYLTQPPQQHDWHKSRGTHVSTHCPLVTLALPCSTLSSSLFTLTSSGHSQTPRSDLESLLYSFTFKPFWFFKSAFCRSTPQIHVTNLKLEREIFHPHVKFPNAWISFLNN